MLKTKGKPGRPPVARWDNTKPYDNGQKVTFTEQAAGERILARFSQWIDEELTSVRGKLVECTNALISGWPQPFRASHALTWRTDDLHWWAALNDVLSEIQGELAIWRAQATDPVGWYNAPSAIVQVKRVYEHTLSQLISKTRHDPQYRLDGHGLQALHLIRANAVVVEKLRYSLQSWQEIGRPYFPFS